MGANIDFTPELADLVSFMSRVAISIRMHTPYNGSTRLESAEGHCKHVLWLADSIHSFEDLADAIKYGDIEGVICAVDRHIFSYRLYMTVGSKWVSDPMLTFKTDSSKPGERCDGWILNEGLALLDRINDKAQQAKLVHTEFFLPAGLPCWQVEIDVPHWDSVRDFS
ncbi:conserved protein of unknown function [Acidithiobacillus ferrivorans]|uniref:Uncharacterized protein n=1 Tax=Acidithiobacillus ferrivorans TaxID=160808 RepID=A0A060UUW0_9PROT|nr:hypothetical protein [Acidithiobacillus ferrivorans]CDQ12111.1 conserved hypothetical protein [Acidithiobacillus ferrivorans]SMH64762.1 conserved protein of unknown function [Acidithiobacillus ferrivorans]